MTDIQPKKDWWDELPKKVKDEIDEAIIDLDNGNGLSHEVVVNNYSKFFIR